MSVLTSLHPAARRSEKADNFAQYGFLLKISFYRIVFGDPLGVD